MDRAGLIQRRKARYMAQMLEGFEQTIQPLLPDTAGGAVQDFKGLVRARINALATDAVELIELDGTERNGAAIELRDRLHAEGRP